MQRLLSMANGSASSLYGCISYVVQELILSKFPKDYFKYTAISTELASRNIRRTFGSNTQIEMQKRKKPYIYIQPVYTAMDPDAPFQNIPLTRNVYDIQYGVDNRFVFPVVVDPENGYDLTFKMNRDKIEFDVNIVTNTLHQQIDLYKTIQNQMVWEIPFTHRTALESVIPKPMVAVMSKLSNMDVEKDRDNIPLLNYRLNSRSKYPITYKCRNASDTDEWFMYYTHNVILTFFDLQIDAGQRKNMVEEAYPVTFRVNAEFNMPGVYFITGDRDKAYSYDLTLTSVEYNEDNNVYIPLCTVENLTEKFPRTQNGQELYGSMMFKCTEDPVTLQDRIDLKGILDADHRKAIQIHKSLNMLPSTLLTPYVMKNNQLCTYMEDYYVDWNTLELVIKHPDPEAFYRLIVYFNMEMVNDILIDNRYEGRFDYSKLRDNSELLPADIRDELPKPEDEVQDVATELEKAIHEPEMQTVIDPTTNEEVEEEVPVEKFEEIPEPEEKEPSVTMSAHKFSSEVKEAINPYKDLTYQDLMNKSATEIHNMQVMQEEEPKKKTGKKKFSSSV